jgi:hypothetical protein
MVAMAALRTSRIQEMVVLEVDMVMVNIMEADGLFLILY